MAKAKLVKELRRDERGHAAVYELSEPLDGNKFVVVSAVDLGAEAHILDSVFGNPRASCETYIFAADENGNVSEWGELDGSFKGGKDHARALRGAGYEIAA